MTHFNLQLNMAKYIGDIDEFKRMTKICVPDFIYLFSCEVLSTIEDECFGNFDNLYIFDDHINQ